MQDNILTIGNPYVQPFDKRKGSVQNRMACAAELAANNLKTNTQALGVGAGTVLLADSFGDKKIAPKVMNKVTEFLSNNKFTSGAYAKASDFVAKNGSKVKNMAANMLNKAKNTKLGKKLVSSEILQTAVGLLKKNKVAATLIAGGAIILGIITKGCHKDGRIEQKYEDKAKIQ